MHNSSLHVRHQLRLVVLLVLAAALTAGGCDTAPSGERVVDPAASVESAVEPIPDMRFVSLPFEDFWHEAVSSAQAMSALETAGGATGKLLHPTTEPDRTFVSRGGSPDVLLEFREAAMTINPQNETDVKAGYASQLVGVDEASSVSEFNGHPAFGIEKGTTTGDPSDNSKPWSYASATALVWTVDGYEYHLLSDTLNLSELQEFARTVLALTPAE